MKYIFLKLTFLLLFISSNVFSQSFESQLDEINKCIKQEKYIRADNICRFLLKNPNISDEDRSLIQGKINWISHLRSLELDIIVSVKKKKYNDAVVIIDKNKKQGISSSTTKELSETLSRLEKYKNTSTEQRYLDKAEGYIKLGNFQRALEILRLFPNNPNAKILLSTISKNKEHVASSTPTKPPCDEVTYTRLKREMEKEYATCHLEAAKSKARSIKQMECYSNDRSAAKVLENIQDIQVGLRNIAAWRSGGDNSKRDFIMPEYERIFKKNRNCVEWDYFYYVYSSAERMRANSPCNKEIIARLLTAQRISTNLAQKEGIAQKISSIENCVDCEGKITLFVNIFNSAKDRYRRCQYDEAISLYGEAQQILSSCTSSKVEQLMKEWEEIKVEIETNRRVTNRFNWLKSAADSLRALDQCETAHKYYLEADSLQTKCGALVKTDLVAKIKSSNCCRLNLQFDNFIDSSKRAQRLNLFRDGLRFADSALVVGRGNTDCISPQKIKNLEDYLCLTYKKGCPVIVVPPKEDTTIYRGIEIIGGAFYNNPTLTSSVRTNLPSWGWGGWTGGANFIVGNRYGELKVGGQFSQNYFKIQNQFADNEEFDFQLIKAGLEANIRLMKKRKTYPFVTIGGFGNFPLSFAYSSTLNANSVKGASYLSGGFGFKAGLGIAIRNKITLSLVYDRVGIVEENSFKANLGPLFLEKSIYQTVGVNASYRIVKMVHKNKILPTNKR